jgi:hypothetical protein
VPLTGRWRINIRAELPAAEGCCHVEGHNGVQLVQCSRQLCPPTLLHSEMLEEVLAIDRLTDIMHNPLAPPQKGPGGLLGQDEYVDPHAV